MHFLICDKKKKEKKRKWRQCKDRKSLTEKKTGAPVLKKISQAEQQTGRETDADTRLSPLRSI